MSYKDKHKRYNKGKTKAKARKATYKSYVFLKSLAAPARSMPNAK